MLQFDANAHADANVDARVNEPLFYLKMELIRSTGRKLLYLGSFSEIPHSFAPVIFWFSMLSNEESN